MATVNDALGDGVDPDAAARGAVFATLARAFQYPTDEFHDAAVTGALESSLQQCLDRTPLDVSVPDLRTDDDYQTLAARYNDLFELGYSEYTDRTDGSLEASGPPVPLYESKYRPDQSWNDVNLDLARAYDHYGIEIDDDQRDNHDALRYELEFAGYLARREAAVDDAAATARLDFHDRHLGHAAAGIAERIDDEPGTDVYDGLARLLESFVRADRNDLAVRLEGD
ncbi:DMSO reductase family type II enzyme chaperone [Haloplanus vescus]|uniref:DMSO reductase family type II enzyme chaperone n=1 Tax=Haloplanus vescus TaxID=555874 RepID=A0A1H3VTM6_9EURY|nr:molecular chaperone TorD family protein [Haloplanus vescus]SDZ78119.1 DMSO reductase family type II enzyme chaperone [Haloplanus vescus]